MAQNFYLYDNLEKKFIPLHSNLVIGRSEGDLRFPKDDLLSRRHCQFQIVGQFTYVEDLESRNHTRVNSVPLAKGKRRKLMLNDVIECGRRRFILSNQCSHPPGHISDKVGTSKKFIAAQREDGSLTSHVTDFIRQKTRIVMNHRSYRKLQIKEFSRLRGWDSSTAILVVSLPTVWLTCFIYLSSLGTFAPDLRHSTVSVVGGFFITLMIATVGCGLLHYLLIRKRYRNVLVRNLFVPLGWLVSSLFLVPAELTASLVTDIAENTTEAVCVKRFSPELCARFSEKQWIGYKSLPSKMRQEIIERIALHSK